MYALEPKRCPHCIGGLAAVQLDHAEEFDLRGPVVVCARCDSAPHADERLHVPDDWV
jgi:hypothetical protein